MRTKNQQRLENVIEAGKHYGKTVVFALGVVKTAELVLHKKFL